ncbi:MAG TPA: hypothetical protein VGX91_00040 [Candidatus Cybelea sp.]|jgi:hypothetical protein|nr:hypothetical protein [Candidatus Cybelea sp.]
MFQLASGRTRVTLGALAIGTLIATASLGVVRAAHVSPLTGHVYGCSSGKVCLEGDSSGSPNGVEGISADTNGVLGVTNSSIGSSGVAGIANNTSGYSYGVYGSSANGEGIYGGSTAAHGVYGTSSARGAAGVYGVNTAACCGWGVYGKATNGPGVYGVNNATGSRVNPGVYGTSSQGSGVEGQGPTNNTGVLGISETGPGIAGVSGSGTAVTASAGLGGNLFVGEGQEGGECVMDAMGNLTCTGTIQGGKAARTRHRTSSGRHVLAYASESATATIEDVGTARMAGGVANVQIDPGFASVMDRKWYYVFLTPLGDTRGLYVSLKTAGAFEVRETEHGRSSLDFDYRIVAHPLDAKDDRLPDAPPLRLHGAVRPPPG